MTQLNCVGKNILISGAASGIVSLIPVINIINVPLMLWMGVGGALCVTLLLRENERVTSADALKTGALSGALGGGIFGSVIFLLITNISPEKIEQMMSIIGMFSSSPEEDAEMMEFFMGDQLTVFTLAVLGAALLISVAVGAAGGIIALKINEKKKKDVNKQ